MIAVCGKCGRELAETERCSCDEQLSLTHFEAVIATAAGIGGADRPENIRAALEALTSRPS